MRWVYALVPLILTAVIFGAGWHFFDPSAKGSDIVQFWSGVTTACALVWLISGYFQQSAELRLQRQELQLQREELRKSNVELAAQANALNVQARAIEIQAELARQSAVLNARKEFVTELSVKLIELFKPFESLNFMPGGDTYGIRYDIELYYRDEVLWEKLARGETKAFFEPAARILGQVRWLQEREIEHPIFAHKLPEMVIILFSDFLVIAGRYGEVIKSLAAEHYDQKPFHELAYTAWNVVKEAKCLDDHAWPDHAPAPQRDIVSGTEWIRRANRPGIEAGIRYLFEGDTKVFAQAIRMIEPYERPGDPPFIDARSTTQ
jgi:hypothetical protein